MTFSIVRTELSIVNSTETKITNIFPTIVSANSFLDSVKFALNLSPC